MAAAKHNVKDNAKNNAKDNKNEQSPEEIQVRLKPILGVRPET